MIDLHTHILPGIDDGPSAMADSVTLARQMATDGVSTVVATPHLRWDHPKVDPLRLSEWCELLRRELQQEQISLGIISGGELDLQWALAASDEQLRLTSLGQTGQTMLLETPYGELPPEFEQLVFKLSLAGYRIVLAHPERNPTFQRNPERLKGMVDRGILVQLTGAACVNVRRSRSGRYARALLEQGLVHVIASDAHAPNRHGRVSLPTAVEHAEKVCGNARAQWLATTAPQALLDGTSLPTPPPVRQSVFRRFDFARRS